MNGQVHGDTSISSHAMHMRRALDDIRHGMEKLRTKMSAYDRPDVLFACMHPNGDGEHANHHMKQLIHSAWISSQRYDEERIEGLKNVHERLYGDCVEKIPIDTIRVDDNGASWEVIQPTKKGSNNEDTTEDTANNRNDAYSFKQQYCIRNVPCIIRGLNKSPFAEVSAQWQSADCMNQDQEDDNNLEKKNVKINTEWFRRRVGGDTLVPVRVDNSIANNGISDEDQQVDGLDEDGRAQECETKHMKMSEWIDLCHEQSQGENNYTANTTGRECGYLKDWHLIQHLSEKCKQNNDEPSPPLYTAPDFFRRDLFGNFLQRYSDGGDYKFVYWGPARSQTRLHSDVLHSFSWSYNVVGRKKWIFYVPPCSNDGRDNTINKGEQKSFEIIQHTGECIFVPSTWQHEVINLVETLSINHNWITVANIDQTYECLKTEIISIEKEVKEWGIPDDDFEARENMLRGCVGMNITMFTLMTLLEMVELLLLLSEGTEADKYCEGRTWDDAYSLFRLQNILTIVLSQSDTTHRLEAMLESQAQAAESMDYAKEAIKYASILIHTDQS